MLLPRHCFLQEGLGSEPWDLDWYYVMVHAAAAGTAGDLLQLALNCTKMWVAERATFATASIRPHLEADVARRLMLTAAVRQHGHAVLYLARSQLYKRQLDVSTVDKLLHLMVCCPNCIPVLCTMPAAAQLSSKQVASLLHKVVQSNHCCTVSIKPLLSLPAAEHLSSVCMEQLLRSVVSVCVPPDSVEMLCSTPAARALSCDAVARLLQAAAQLGQGLWEDMHYKDCTRHLRQLPAARMLSQEVLGGNERGYQARSVERLL
jgi:hypothetical protein